DGPSSTTSTSYPSRDNARDSGPAIAASSSTSSTVVMTAECRPLSRTRPPTARMPRVTPAQDLELALRIADAADTVTLDRFRAADLRVDRKPDRTPVTDADLACEDEVRRLLAEARPDDVVLGEERGGTAPDTGRHWIVDPIDGTKNFSRGVPVFATLLGLV